MSSFDLILRDIQLSVNSFISHYVSDYQRYCVPELWLQRRRSMLEDYIYIESNIFINDLLYWKAPNTLVSSILHTWKLSGHFTKVLKCSHSQLPKQVRFVALNSWTQRAEPTPKAMGQSCAESVEIPACTGVESRGRVRLRAVHVSISSCSVT